jgi:hypothetical protein
MYSRRRGVATSPFILIEKERKKERNYGHLEGILDDVKSGMAARAECRGGAKN